MRPPTRQVSTLGATLTPRLVAASLGVVLLAGGGAAAALTGGVDRERAGQATVEPSSSAALPREPARSQPLDLPTAEPVAPAAPAAPPPASAAPSASPSPSPGEPGPASPSPGPVAPLTGLRRTDLVVTLPRSLTTAQLAALQALTRLEALAVVDAGTLPVAGQDARVIGVDASQFRAFTPQETAASDALWQSVARGELAPSYALQRSRRLVLGTSLTVASGKGRIGAVAAYGLPGVDLVTSRATARSLGLTPSSAVLVSAPARSIGALEKAVRTIVGPGAEVEVLRPAVVAPRTGGPKTYRDLYVDGARYCPGLSWTVLAAIGQVESAHGTFLGPSSAGALGPMQFLPTTWADYGVDGDGDGKADIMSPFDAIPAAARYLCRFGANRGPEGLYDAVFAYNHLDAYVQKVLATARAYGGKV